MRLPALLVTGAAIVFASPAFPRDMVVALQGGPGVEAKLRQAELHPFSDATGIPVDALGWPGGLDPLHQAAADSPAWDLAQLRAAELRQACDQGLVEKLDWNAIGGRDRYLPIATADCGVGAYLLSVVLAWNPQKFAGSPTWADFWDVAKVPGKRGLQKRARDNLEIALLADGVAPGDVYATLRTSDGIDRAFRKLDQLKPYVVWWDDVTQPAGLLDSGQVLMSSARNDQVSDAPQVAQHPLAIQWSASLYGVTFWAIVKGSPHRADAQNFLVFAGDPARQVQLLPLGSVVKGVADQIAASPSAPANLANALRVDAAFWHDNDAALETRFQQWLNH